MGQPTVRRSLSVSPPTLRSRQSASGTPGARWIIKNKIIILLVQDGSYLYIFVKTVADADVTRGSTNQSGRMSLRDMLSKNQPCVIKVGQSLQRLILEKRLWYRRRSKKWGTLGFMVRLPFTVATYRRWQIWLIFESGYHQLRAACSSKINKLRAAWYCRVKCSGPFFYQTGRNTQMHNLATIRILKRMQHVLPVESKYRS